MSQPFESEVQVSTLRKNRCPRLQKYAPDSAILTINANITPNSKTSVDQQSIIVKNLKRLMPQSWTASFVGTRLKEWARNHIVPHKTIDFRSKTFLAEVEQARTVYGPLLALWNDELESLSDKKLL